MTTDRTALEAALDIGALMANCMFNLKQGGSIGERERAIFADLQTKWDAASRSARAALSSPPVLPAELVALTGKWDGAEYWMPLAWALCADECGEDACTELVWEGGPVPEPWGDRWLKYEDEAKRLIALVRENTLPAAAPQKAAPALDDARDADTKRLDWIEARVCDVSRLGDSARTLRISWNNGADYVFVGPPYHANWREAIDAAMQQEPRS